MEIKEQDTGKETFPKDYKPTELNGKEQDYWVDYPYGFEKQKLRPGIEVESNLTGGLFASMQASSNMTIPNSTDTTITNLLTKSGDSVMTATNNQITITQDGNYLLSAFTFAGWSSTVVFRIMKNGVTLDPHFRSGTSSAGAITASINIIEPLVAGDILTLLIFQNSGGNQTLQASRLSVLKI